MTELKKEYLGDGAYVSFDGYAIVLTTEDGLNTTNRVVLEPQILEHFEGWLDRLRSDQDTPKQVDCPTCQGKGYAYKATREEPAGQCEDCNGTGVEHGR